MTTVSHLHHHRTQTPLPQPPNTTSTPWSWKKKWLRKIHFNMFKRLLLASTYCQWKWNEDRKLCRIKFKTNYFIKWKTKMQKKSSIHPRKSIIYRALTVVTCKLLWLSYVMHDLHVKCLKQSLLYYDNQSALHITTNLMFHECIMHLEIDCHVERNVRFISYVCCHYQALIRLWIYFLRSKIILLISL